MVITWHEVTSTDVAPAAAGDALPTRFRVERKIDGDSNYTVIGTMANSSSHSAGKIKLRDKTALPAVPYRYRLVVIYEAGENPQEYTLRDSKVKRILHGAFDFKLKATSAPAEIALSWRPAVWEATRYDVYRKLAAEAPASAVKIGEVAHDTTAKRLTFTDTTAVSGQAYTYYLAPFATGESPADTTVVLEVTVE